MAKSINDQPTPIEQNGEQKLASDLERPISLQSTREEHKRSFKPLLAGLVSAFSLLIASFIFSGFPVYENNSDVAMTLIASGVGLADSPDYHILFSSTLIGAVLSALYRLAPSIAWYGIYIIGSQLVALAAIIVLLVRKKSALSAAVLSAALITAIGVRGTHLVEFTTTAGLLGIAGALYFLAAIEEEHLGKRFWLFATVSAFFFEFSCVVRWQSSIMFLMLAGIAFASSLLTKCSKRRIAIASGLLGVLSLLVLSANALSMKTYDQPGWRDYHRLNYAYARMFEYQKDLDNSPTTFSIWEKVGWSPTDVSIARNWYHLDENIFSADKVLAVDRALPRINIDFDLNRILKKVRRALEDITIRPMLLVALLSLMVIDRKRLSLLSVALLVLGLVAALFGIAIALKLPARVYAPIFAFLPAVLLYFASPESMQRMIHRRNVFAWVVGAIALILIIPVQQFYGELARKGEKQFLLLQENVRSLGPTSDKLYVTWGDAFPFGWIRPFDNVHELFTNFKLLRIGAIDRIPLVRDRMSEFGITDLMESLDAPGIFLISHDRYNSIIRDFMIEHYRQRPIFDVQMEDRRIPLFVYKVRKSCDVFRRDTDQDPHCPDFKEHDLIVFPGQSQGDWQYKMINPLRSLAGETQFENSGPLPTITRNNPLDVKISKGMRFAIEMSVNPWIVWDRQAVVQLMLDGEQGYKSFSLPLLPDGSMHRYVFNLDSLLLAPGSRITHMNVLPLHVRRNYSGETLSIRRFGFIYPPGSQTTVR